MNDEIQENDATKNVWALPELPRLPQDNSLVVEALKLQEDLLTYIQKVEYAKGEFSKQKSTNDALREYLSNLDAATGV
jgi:regulator of sirC expression with transglutaminase-like and TPR domain